MIIIFKFNNIRFKIFYTRNTLLLHKYFIDDRLKHVFQYLLYEFYSFIQPVIPFFFFFSIKFLLTFLQTYVYWICFNLVSIILEKSYANMFPINKRKVIVQNFSRFQINVWKVFENTKKFFRYDVILDFLFVFFFFLMTMFGVLVYAIVVGCSRWC